MKKILCFFILTLFSAVSASNLTYKLSVTSSLYYPEYTVYNYDEPLLGINLNAEFYNLLGKTGLGSSYLYQLKSYDNRVEYCSFADFYIHSLFATKGDAKYFLYGFYGGVRYSKLEFDHYKTQQSSTIKMSRPLLGFKFASHNWGIDFNWSQAENRKPILGYEVKFRNERGIIFQIGRRNRGPMIGAKSDFYFLAGYEFFN
jgi:hypothetical protein